MVGPLEQQHVLHGLEVQRLSSADEDLTLMFTGQLASFQDSCSTSFSIIHIMDADAHGGECALGALVPVQEASHALLRRACDVFIVVQQLSLEVDRTGLHCPLDDAEDVGHAVGVVDLVDRCVFQLRFQLPAKGVEQQDACLLLWDIVDNLYEPHFNSSLPFLIGSQVTLLVVPNRSGWRLSSSVLHALHGALEAVPGRSRGVIRLL